MNGRTRRSGISLLETLLVAGIVGVLIALSMPAIQRVRATADSMGCKSRLHQLGLALAHFHHDHGCFPPAAYTTSTAMKDLTAMNAGGWRVALLPYLEQQALWRQTVAAWEQSKSPFEVPPHVGYITPLKIFTCPADGRLDQVHPDPAGRLAAYGSYIGVRGSGFSVGWQTADGMLGPGYRMGISMAEVHDGLSNTLMVGERPPPNTFEAGRWYTNFASMDWGYLPGPDEAMFVEIIGPPRGHCQPPFFFSVGRLDNPCDRFHFWSLHSGGAHFLFADGSVRFLAYSARNLMPALATRAGGEKVTLD